MQHESRWEPLPRRDGDAARRARLLAAIAAVAEALETPVTDLGHARPPSQAVDLADGSAGTALLFAYLSRASRGVSELGDPDRWAEVASHHLEHAIQGVGAIALGPGLFAGFTGVAWSMAHVARMLEIEIEIPDSIDSGLIDLVTARWSSESYDLVSGLVGLGVYFLERLPHPLASRGLLAILERLAELAHRDTNGIAWHTPPQKLPEPQRRQFPEGYYDLGLAHGLAGVVAFLVRAHAAGIAERCSLELLEGAVAWLLAHELDARQGGGFPWAHVPGRAPRPARAAWCYGDPGIGIALLQAATWLRRPAWAIRARSLVEAAARRLRETSGIVDISVCHGSAGLLHMVNRVHQRMPSPALRDAIDVWLDWTLDARTEAPGPAVAGFRALTHQQGELVWVAERGLLNGAAGVGLVLLGIVSDVTPAWDRVLLLSGGGPR
jgi:lantibiotic modifying enzyme